MNEIIKSQLINNNEIDLKNYTLSLLDIAYKKGIIAEKKVQDIQLEIMQLLSENILLFTKENSSSVKTETAESLLSSILYCLNFYLLGFNDAQKCLDVLKTEHIKKIYENSTAFIKDEINASKELFKLIKANKISTELIAYNDTIDGLNEFFYSYNAEFSAHEAPCSIDYPLCFEIIDLQGVMYMKSYLKSIYLENEFCSLFNDSEINNMLTSYGNLYKFDYKDMLINIFKLVINNSLFSFILGKNPVNLSITKQELIYIDKKFQDFSQSDINDYVNEAFKELIFTLSINDRNLIEYINRYKKLFLNELTIHSEERTLSKFVITSISDIKSTIKINENKKLSDEQFKVIINEISSCKEINEKVNIITTEINNFEDFIDMLNAGFLTKDEYTSLFNELEEIESAMLLNHITQNQPYFNIFYITIDTLHLSSAQILWQTCFTEFIKSLSQAKLNNIEYFLANLEC